MLVGGRDVCTATLISPSIIITSGHCVMKERQDGHHEMQDMAFLVKSKLDGKRRIFGVVDLALPPGYAYRNRINPGILDLTEDVALLKLDGLATRSHIVSIDNPNPGQTNSYIHGQIAPDRAPVGRERCDTAILQNGIMVLSCYRENGFSGSPVIQVADDGVEIVAIVAANTVRAGQRVLYAVPPLPVLEKMIWKRGLAAHQSALVARKSVSKQPRDH